MDALAAHTINHFTAVSLQRARKRYSRCTGRVLRRGRQRVDALAARALRLPVVRRAQLLRPEGVCAALPRSTTCGFFAVVHMLIHG